MDLNNRVNTRRDKARRIKSKSTRACIHFRHETQLNKHISYQQNTRYHSETMCKTPKYSVLRNNQRKCHQLHQAKVLT